MAPNGKTIKSAWQADFAEWRWKLLQKSQRKPLTSSKGLIWLGAEQRVAPLALRYLNDRLCL
jgi:hypothetical protein